MVTKEDAKRVLIANEIRLNKLAANGKNLESSGVMRKVKRNIRNARKVLDS